MTLTTTKIARNYVVTPPTDASSQRYVHEGAGARAEAEAWRGMTRRPMWATTAREKRGNPTKVRGLSTSSAQWPHPFTIICARRRCCFCTQDWTPSPLFHSASASLLSSPASFLSPSLVPSLLPSLPCLAFLYSSPSFPIIPLISHFLTPYPSYFSPNGWYVIQWAQSVYILSILNLLINWFNL